VVTPLWEDRRLWRRRAGGGYGGDACRRYGGGGAWLWDRERTTVVMELPWSITTSVVMELTTRSRLPPPPPPSPCVIRDVLGRAIPSQLERVTTGAMAAKV
jgi:hypothetical protein